MSDKGMSDIKERMRYVADTLDDFYDKRGKLDGMKLATELREKKLLEQRIAELERALKAKGVACLKHDLVGGLACPRCLHEAEQDARRYRWLRDSRLGCIRWADAAHFQKQIDEAMKGGEG